MQRNAAASVINPLYKSSLFSSHFKLHGISVAPDSPQSYPLIHKCPGFHCHQAPTNVREAHRVLGEGFLKNSEQALQWRGESHRTIQTYSISYRLQHLWRVPAVWFCWRCAQPLKAWKVQEQGVTTGLTITGQYNHITCSWSLVWPNSWPVTQL